MNGCNVKSKQVTCATASEVLCDLCPLGLNTARKTNTYLNVLTRTGSSNLFQEWDI